MVNSSSNEGIITSPVTCMIRHDAMLSLAHDAAMPPLAYDAFIKANTTSLPAGALPFSGEEYEVRTRSVASRSMSSRSLGMAVSDADLTFREARSWRAH